MDFYETDLMSHPQAVEFVNQFDKEVGTECEICDAGNGDFYVICCELEDNEVDICREIENELTAW